MMPPTPWTGNTSRESSIFKVRLIKLVAPKQIIPALIPIMIAPIGPTKPEAGVILPKPATMPVTMPNTLGLPYLIHSKNIQVSEARAALMCVTRMAMPASPLAASALPPLKPNQPTQSMPAPVTVMVRLCGGKGVVGKPWRLPTMMAATSAPTPAVICTTRPPAKSIAPISLNQPPPQTQ